MTMLVMLGVLFMLITRASEVRTWKWLSGEVDTEIWSRAGLSQVDSGTKHKSPDPTPSVSEAARSEQQSAKEPVANDLQFNDPDLPDNTPTNSVVADEGSQNKPSALNQTLQPGSSEQSAQNEQTPGVQLSAGDATTASELAGTDLDPEERQAAQEHYEVLSDRTLELQPEEMPVYWRQFFWTKNQTFEQMEKRAARQVVFNQFMQRPSKQRGNLVRLELQAKQVLSYDVDPAENPAGVDKVYEIWGHSTQSGAWLYCVVTPELPAGMPIGARVNEKIIVVGYFLKLQGYHEAGAGPKDKPLAAPLIVGRVHWKASAKPPAASDAEWFGWWWWLIVAAAVLIGAKLVLPLFFWKRSAPAVSPVSIFRKNLDERDDAKIGAWLAQAQASESHGDADQRSSNGSN